MTNEAKNSGLEHMEFIEATNALADAMDGMKLALTDRGWSPTVSEQVGAAFGASLFQMVMGQQKGSKK